MWLSGREWYGISNNKFNILQIFRIVLNFLFTKELLLIIGQHENKVSKELTNNANFL